MGRSRQYQKTPRTDECIVEINGKEYVYAAFARKLEMELAELQSKQPEQFAAHDEGAK